MKDADINYIHQPYSTHDWKKGCFHYRCYKYKCPDCKIKFKCITTAEPIYLEFISIDGKVDYGTLRMLVEHILFDKGEDNERFSEDLE